MVRGRANDGTYHRSAYYHLLGVGYRVCRFDNRDGKVFEGGRGMTEVDEKSFIEQMKKAIDDMNRQQAEYEHKQLIRLCEENDFIVPNEEVRKQLEGVLPEGTMINV